MAKTAKKSQDNTYEFGAETGKILQLMINSLYANKEIFLRELISNASDACDKLRYMSITEPSLLGDDADLKIKISYDEKARTLTIEDNGIGMNKADLINNLGTIARSGTQDFLSELEKNKGNVNLIGQFGVGFYSSFMAADEVTVISRKAGEKKAWQWQSKADGKYTVEEAESQLERGTSIKLHIKDDSKEFLDKHRIRHIIKTYSDHIGFPVELTDDTGKTEVVNKASALWTLPKSEVTDEQYNEFYKHVAHAGDKPWMILHNKVEGTLQYSNLLFIPSVKPFDLFHPDRETRVKLYVKRVFISDNNVDVIPRHLRFIRGVVDSEDLPLNISRETLQHNNVLYKIKNALTKKILSELKKKAENEPEDYQKFWDNFGSTIKEGLCEAGDANREILLEICRFRTLNSPDKLSSLDDYIGNMKEDQKAIYYLTGDNIDSLKDSPQLEGFKKKGIDVILLSDHVDDFWVTVTHEYKDKAVVSVNRAGIDLDDREDKAENADNDNNKEESAKIIKFFKEILDDKVHDVVVSKKLSDTPACLALQEGAMDIRMERFLISNQQLKSPIPKIFEVNVNHPLVKYIGSNIESEDAKDLVFIIFDQACIIEGETISDTGAFARRFNKFLERIV